MGKMERERIGEEKGKGEGKERGRTCLPTFKESLPPMNEILADHFY